MRTAPILVLLLASPLLAQRGTNWKATGAHGAVAAGGQGAVDAGIGTLKSGGNAIDGRQQPSSP
jgi:gamma-glutamyltranspeptidase